MYMYTDRTYVYIHKERQVDRESQNTISSQAVTHTSRHIKYTGRHTDRQVYRQRETQIERQTTG